MNESILVTIKNMLNADYDVFDKELVVHINAALSTLHQLGVGPKNGLSITGEKEIWSDLTTQHNLQNLCKTFIYLKVRLLWDPPTSGNVMSSLKNQLDETEWRITAYVENRATSSSDNSGSGGTDDYELLMNLPKLNGKTIIGNVSETDPTVNPITSLEATSIFEEVFKGGDDNG